VLKLNIHSTYVVYFVYVWHVARVRAKLLADLDWLESSGGLDREKNGLPMPRVQNLGVSCGSRTVDTHEPSLCHRSALLVTVFPDAPTTPLPPKSSRRSTMLASRVQPLAMRTSPSRMKMVATLGSARSRPVTLTGT